MKGDPLNDKKNELVTPEKAFEDHANGIIKNVPELRDHRTTLHGMFQLGFEHGVASAKRRLNDAADGLLKSNNALAKAYERMKEGKARNESLLKTVADLTRKKVNLENALHQELRKHEGGRN